MVKENQKGKCHFLFKINILNIKDEGNYRESHEAANIQSKEEAYKQLNMALKTGVLGSQV